LARLVYRKDDGTEDEVPLSFDGTPTVIGRKKSCAIRTDNNTVSREHAEVRWVDGSYHLRDRGSSNGTFYEQERIAERWLEDGDVFHCGAFPLRFVLDPEDGTSEAADLEGSAAYPVAEELSAEVNSIQGIEFGNSDSVETGFDAEELKDLLSEDSAVIEAQPFEPPDFEKVQLAEPAQFVEFDRQLKLKNTELDELREALQTSEFRVEILEKKSEALQKELNDTIAPEGPSSEEYAELTDRLEQTEATVAERDRELADSLEELQSLEDRVLKLSRDQPSEKTITDLKAAKEERDRLLSQQEDKETVLLELKKEYDALRGKYDDSSVAEEALTGALDAAKEMEKKLASLENRPTLDELETSKSSLAEVEKVNTDLRSKIEELESFARDRSEAESLTEQADSLRSQIKLLEEERDVANSARDQADDEAGKQSKRADGLESQNAELKEMLAGMPEEEQVKTLESERNSAVAERDGLSDELSKLETQYAEKQLESAESASTEIENLKADLKKANASLDDAKSDASDAVKSQVAEVKSATKEREGLAEQVSEFEEKVKELEDILVHAPSKSQFEELQTQLETIEKERDTLEKKVFREEAKRKELESASKLAEADGSEKDAAASSLQKQLTTAEAALEKAEGVRDKAVETASELKENLKEAQAESKSAEKDLGKLKDALAGMEGAASTAAGQKDELKGVHKDLDKAQKEIGKLTEALDAAQTQAKGGDDAAARVTELEEQLEHTEEEKSDLLAANKAQLKQNSDLQKTIEKLKAKEAGEAETAGVASSRFKELEEQLDEERSKCGDAEKALETASADLKAANKALAEATERTTTLENARDELAGSATEVESLMKQLTAAEAACKEAQEESIRGRTKYESLEGSLEQAQGEITGLHQELEKSQSVNGAELAVESRARDAISAARELVEDVNDRISVFKNNCETVQFCLDDIKNGVDVSDNHIAAVEMLQQGEAEAEAIKKAIKKFRQKNLS
jgi:chromosome segregation ATPase